MLFRYQSYCNIIIFKSMQELMKKKMQEQFFFLSYDLWKGNQEIWMMKNLKGSGNLDDETSCQTCVLWDIKKNS